MTEQTNNLPKPFLVRILFLALLLFLAVVLTYPGAAFFANRGGIAFLEGTDFRTASVRLFPLLGLYAFTLVFLQVLIGSSLDLVRRAFPGVFAFHRAEGITALVFAALHPVMLLVGFGPSGYFRMEYVAPSLKLYAWLGYVQLLLLLVTVLSALLMRRPWFQRRWRTLHYANYVVFAAAWVHGWFLGSDVQQGPLRGFWFFAASVAAIAVVRRFLQAAKKRRASRGTPVVSIPPTSIRSNFG